MANLRAEPFSSYLSMIAIPYAISNPQPIAFLQRLNPSFTIAIGSFCCYSTHRNRIENAHQSQHRYRLDRLYDGYLGFRLPIDFILQVINNSFISFLSFFSMTSEVIKQRNVQKLSNQFRFKTKVMLENIFLF